MRHAEVIVQQVDKQNVVEGLARLTALLPPPAAAKAAQHLIGPFLQAAQVDLQTDPGDCLLPFHLVHHCACSAFEQSPLLMFAWVVCSLLTYTLMSRQLPLIVQCLMPLHLPHSLVPSQYLNSPFCLCVPVQLVNLYTFT